MSQQSACIYTRVATKQQTLRNGQARQEALCRALCQQRVWEVAGALRRIASLVQAGAFRACRPYRIGDRLVWW